MRVLAVSSWFPYPPDNGSKLRAFALLRELAKKHEVTLLSFSEEPSPDPPSRLREVCRVIRTVGGSPYKPREPLSLAGLFSPIPRSYRRTFSHEMQDLVDRELVGQDAAIAFQIGASLYLRGKAVPRIFEEAEIGVLLQQFSEQPIIRRRIRSGATLLKYSRFVRGLVDDFDRTTVVSDLERQHLLRARCDGDRLVVVPNGTDVQAELPRVEVGRTVLIYPGSLTYTANLDAVQYFLSEIWPVIRRAEPETTFLVTGSTQGVRLEDLPNREGVSFSGNVPNIDELIVGSSACVVPLRIGGGTRLKILQAMALGTPVVATPKGAEGLLVTSGRDILLGNTPNEFAEWTVRLMREPDLRRRVSIEGRELVQRCYDWRVIGAQLEALIQEATDHFRSR